MLVVCQEVPNLSSSAASSVARGILNNDGIDEQIHCLGYRIIGSKAVLEDPPFKYNYLPIPERGERYSRFLLLPALLLMGLWIILIRRHKSLMAIFPDDASLLCGYLLALITGIRFIPYYLDLYTETGTWHKPLDKWLQRRSFARAFKLVVVNEGMQNYYKEKYKMESICLPHLFQSEPLPIRMQRSPGATFTIAYAGSINGARIKGLQLLVEAIETMPDVRMQYFSRQPKSLLKKHDLWREEFGIRNVADPGRLLQELAQCDLLFNPVYSGVISEAHIGTSFGTKMVEYIASGVPILIDTDPKFFTYKFLSKYKVGILVDHANVESIRSRIRDIKSSEDLYRNTANSNLNLRDYFSPEQGVQILNSLTR